MTATVDAAEQRREVVVAELGVLRALVRDDPPEAVDAAREALDAARLRLGTPCPLDRVTEGFGLSGFERSVLLLAAGPHLIATVSEELRARTGDGRLSFGGALAVLPGGHWSALTPAAPLRRWGLVAPLDPASFVSSPLGVDERVLHHLAGAGYPDPVLSARAARPVAGSPLVGPLLAAADDVGRAWRAGQPVLLAGPQRANLRAVATEAAGHLGFAATVLSAADLPPDAVECEALLRRMERETVLAGAAWVIECDGDPDRAGTALRAATRLDAPVAVTSGSVDAEVPAQVAVLRVGRLGVADRRRALLAGLAVAAPSATVAAEVAQVAGVLDLAVDGIARAADEVAAGAGLWEACRRQSVTALGSLAEVVTPRAGWDDLVLPDGPREQLRALVSAVRHRSRVLDDWGFGERTVRGLGATALFAGPSGTGKTLAAEVIAGELDLALAIVDLSQVVNKYIGETEKHLRRVFDAAEDGGCVLLFDEADTLFGRRSEVRDSHDRYANLEVGYLLQRMESFRGLAILTTNARDALDPAFTRRLRTIVTFPYPSAQLREDLWRNAFPPSTPLDDLDLRGLAAEDLPGGGIAAAALGAAYLAAGNGSGPVTLEHLRTSVRWELAKTGRAGRNLSLEE